MKRTKIEIEDIASFANLAKATTNAAYGKRWHQDVAKFFKNFDQNLNKLRNCILDCSVPYGNMSQFTIFDPKKRTIHAPCFEDRVLHHAVMNFVSPVLERAMVDSSFACRPGKGAHAAVRQVHKNIQRYPWYVKIDIENYFGAIDHDLLFRTLERRLKGHEMLKLIKKIIGSYQTDMGKGLPIGALPSQHFANYFLDELDRYIMEKLGGKAHVRYMDDVIWWCDSRQQAKQTLAHIVGYTEKKLLLEVKSNAMQINRSKRGVTYCGFNILPGTIKLSPRKRKRYTTIRNKWENAYRCSLINEDKLQLAFASVNAITLHADSVEWKKQQLQRYPAPDC